MSYNDRDRDEGGYGGQGGRYGNSRPDDEYSSRRDQEGGYDRSEARRDDRDEGGYGGHGGRQQESRYGDDRDSGRRDYERPGGNEQHGRNQDYYSGDSGRRNDDNDRQSGGRQEYGGGGGGYGEEHRRPQGGGGFGGSYGNDDDDMSQARRAANRYSGKNEDDDDDDTNMFSQALGFLNGKKKNNEINEQDIDEQRLVNAHKQSYGGEGNLDSGNAGAAAAMQALKMFSGGQASGKQSQSDFVGLAMSEASKLMGGKPQQEKQSAITQAAEIAFKLYMNGQKTQTGGSGGSSGLLGLASKFLQ